MYNRTNAKEGEKRDIKGTTVVYCAPFGWCSPKFYQMVLDNPQLRNYNG